MTYITGEDLKGFEEDVKREAQKAADEGRLVGLEFQGGKGFILSSESGRMVHDKSNVEEVIPKLDLSDLEGHWKPDLTAACERLQKVYTFHKNKHDVLLEALCKVIVDSGCNPCDFEIIMQAHEDGIGMTTYIRPRSNEPIEDIRKPGPGIYASVYKEGQ